MNNKNEVGEWLKYFGMTQANEVGEWLKYFGMTQANEKPQSEKTQNKIKKILRDIDQYNEKEFREI